MKRFLLLAGILIALVPVSASAHLEGQEFTDGAYTIEIGSEPAQDLQPGQSVAYTLALAKNEVHIENFRAWLRISHGDQITFSSFNLVSDGGVVVFSATYPEAGDYDLRVRLTDSKTGQQAEATDHVTVTAPTPTQTVSPQPAPNLLLIFLAGLVVGALACLIL